MNEPFIQCNENYLHIEKWQKTNPKLIAGFTTRNGGVSTPPFHTLNTGLHVHDEHKDVITNRRKLSESLNIPLSSWVSGEQVHHTNVKQINSNDKGKGAITYQSSIKGIDGLITNEKGILCTAFFADCIPLYFFDPKTGYIGIAHAGWKGTVSRIAEKMVQELQKTGVNKDDLFVAIGPGISQQFYEVGENVIKHIDMKDREKTVIQQANNRYLLDLKQLNVEILLQSGVLRHNIDITNYCTFNDKDLFFSHRRDNGKTGRMLGFLGFSI
ncbi:hypothetical protein CIL05_08575 [Virgibacillus profundi]|uniref:Purine nucleoside phosphorylase n=1 Tax=Virgibacillus profundi TaxID=2024555 RepID=A0A2A2IFR9_9BACI|nr:peptidoglycan editing factor PgeF [Virgibacillus profundi]PAV29923.1 hypothetical protein CIL05_08575 [Virgibacillus profundi]PXY54095.1 peptidoglycan editing factor PgeF [Virgibacillus profundi]